MRFATNSSIQTVSVLLPRGVAILACHRKTAGRERFEGSGARATPYPRPRACPWESLPGLPAGRGHALPRMTEPRDGSLPRSSLPDKGRGPKEHAGDAGALQALWDAVPAREDGGAGREPRLRCGALRAVRRVQGQVPRGELAEAEGDRRRQHPHATGWCILSAKVKTRSRRVVGMRAAPLRRARQ